jgi:aquaporin related protein
MNINEPRHGGGFILPFFNDTKLHRQGSTRNSLKSNRLPFLDWVPDEVNNSQHMSGLRDGRLIFNRLETIS